MNWSEKQFEEKMSEYIDIAYRSVFKIKDIDRSKYSELMTDQLNLDKNYGIDTVLKLTNGSKITIQEKVRKNFYLDKYGACLCLEYMNNPNTKEFGEWFKAIPQLYFVGYANRDETGFNEWYLIDTLRLKVFLQGFSRDELEKRYLKRNTLPKNATFLAVPIEHIKISILFNYTFPTLDCQQNT